MRARDTLTPEIARDLEAMEAAVAGRPATDGDPLLAELAALVAETRPEPDPAWANRLDARNRQGFPRLQARRRSSAARLRRWFFGPALGLAACALIALVIVTSPGNHGDSASSVGGGGGGSASTSAGDSTTASEGARQAAPVPNGQSAPATSDSIVPAPEPAPGGLSPQSDAKRSRKVERSATLTLGARPRNIDATADGVSRVATSLGGYVAASSVSSRQGGSIDLRIPSARLDDAIARLSRLAHVRRLERNSLDITAQSVSARARVADLKAERKSLLGQLTKATTLDEVAKLRARL